MKWADFHTALKPKYDGTRNVVDSFAGADLDFFIMLSSVSGIVGLRGQTNYAAGNVYQDMFVQSQVSKGEKNFVSLNLPLVSESEAGTQEVKGMVCRQGSLILPVATVMPLTDYAMSRAGKDECNQIAFCVNAESMLTRVENGMRITPLLRHVYAGARQGLAGNAQKNAGVSIEKAIAQASSLADAEQLILTTMKDKVSLLLAVDPDELSLDVPITDLGLDSLIAIELKNWVTKTLQASVQTSDIMDAASLRAFTALVTQWSDLVKQGKEETEAEDAAGDQETAAMVLNM